MRLLHVYVVLFLFVTVASAEIIDVGPFGANAYDVGGEEGSGIYAQAFVAPEENIFVLGGMYLYGGGLDPPEIRVDLWGTDADGNPDENNILIAGPVYQQRFDELTLVTVEGNVELVPGERYFMVLNAMIDQEGQNSYASSWSNPNDVYPGGWATWSNDMAASWSNPNGNNWRWDFAFYVETAAASCVGDLDGDGDTDQSDLGVLLADWGCTGGDCPGDCDGDGDTDQSDLGILLADWGCTP